MDEDKWILTILMRTDIDSMNPGKAIAQGSHATSLFEMELTEEVRDEWAEDGIAGTTVVLDGQSMDYIMETLIYVKDRYDVMTGVYTDPSYPIKDGFVVHTFRLTTCAYIFYNTRIKDITTILKERHSWYE